jgi:hypothetical protein
MRHLCRPGYDRPARAPWRGWTGLRAPDRYGRREYRVCSRRGQGVPFTCEFRGPPWSGLFRPVADHAPADRWSDAGLIVPDRSLAAASLGPVPAATTSAWFDRYAKAYVTAGDYLAGALSASGLPFDPVPLINSLLRLHPREVYLQVLVALNHAAHYPELTEEYLDRFLARLNPVMAENVRRALDGTADGMTRALLARQYTAGDPKFGDLPEGLFMEMVANGLFHGHERPDVLLARTRMICE